MSLKIPSKQDVDQYIEWYNSLPIRGNEKPGDYFRRACPFCNEPVFARKDVEGSVVLDLKHKLDCSHS